MTNLTALPTDNVTLTTGVNVVQPIHHLTNFENRYELGKVFAAITIFLFVKNNI